MFETCQDHDFRPENYFQTRRQFLRRFGMGFGALSLAGILGPDFIFSENARAEEISNLEAKLPPLPAKAKQVVHIFAQGAPSHIDTWDPKPALAQYDGQPLPGMNGGVAMPSPFKFERKGQSGIEVSEVFPQLG